MDIRDMTKEIKIFVNVFKMNEKRSSFGHLKNTWKLTMLGKFDLRGYLELKK